jgi:epoxyqueuosine reductase
MSANKLTARMIKDLALKIGGGGGGVEIVGIAPISRFANAPERTNPKNIFPDCQSVISIVQPIPRSTYRGITEGTHWSNYTYYAYNRLNSIFRPMVTEELARLIEDHGFEAVPVYPGVAEFYPNNPRPVPGRPVPEVNIHVRIAAMACGLGEIGWSKVFLHPVYGPRVRIGTILTDAALEADPLIKPGTICKRCMRCVPTCPGNAIPPRNGPKITIKIDDQEYSWGDVNMGRCTATHHGINYKASPFLKRYYPGFNLDITETTMSEELAYKITHSLGRADWRQSPEFPSNQGYPYIKQISAHCGYLAVCGAKGCIRACMAFQEETHNIGQHTFQTPVFPDKPWELPPPQADPTGGVVEKKMLTELYQDPDLDAGQWR